ncbi:RNA-binding S4 domain-containing protein [Photobacterium sanguinicancri]|uniref:Urease n=1 Tax=Photobacterium sanguinicancri TaxID=875932 RepID=A0ABX4FVF1_9GAMM|nr:RNA-binding S4 domain-containing protein [Photobacterium sanguinicancri]OZS42818.1 urease [Photobacterium sanguinicancri]
MSEHEEYEVEALEVEVSAQPIELYKVLKIANVVSGGGEAKFAISEGYVGVNGELEQRKRRKLYDGDVIEFNQEYYVVVCNQPVTEPTEKVVKDVKAAAPVGKKKATAKKSSAESGKADKKLSAKAKPAKSAAKKAPKKSVKKEAEKPSFDQTTGRKSLSF